VTFPNILLDLDGTIADSAPGILASYRATLRELGHTPDPAIDLNFVIGPALPDVMPHVLEPYGDKRTELAVTTYRRIYSEIGVLDATPYEGIPELLRALHSSGKRLFLATAKRTVFARQMLDHFGVAPLFTAIYGSEPGGALDHKPELIAHILAREAIDPANACMSGDRRYDITGAHANGVRAIGVLWGYGGREELEQAGADALVETPRALGQALC
jgi:phosphoglycolate phosphatase